MGLKCGWRVVEWKGGELLSLFHGTQHSRIIPTGKWNKADKKMVTDGSNVKAYESGYHFFETYQDAWDFLNSLRIRKNRKIVAIQARGNLRKKHEHKKIWLADEIFIEEPTYLYG